ncbi:DUF2178 domain-containing protein, partial [Halorubrum sp. SS5]
WFHGATWTLFAIYVVYGVAVGYHKYRS